MPTEITNATGAELTYLAHHAIFQDILYRELKTIREGNITTPGRRIEALDVIAGLIEEVPIIQRNGFNMQRNMPQCLTVTEKPAEYFAIRFSLFEQAMDFLVDDLIGIRHDLRTERDGEMNHHYRVLRRVKELI
ncbi:uncharacterized protein N7511_001619 [Penicillium nucicola]|uniref:uncharacterized protein n=1 Tax=Penicillium nucicola TaxID=1850975 RepID=UPI0025456F78|nr:uncharacterized protein N7511_001619 [Penicillium nucicola]KAJ5776608.1 hypothetical protein N7511_001619 [Penicillium nucicola]